MILQFGTQFLPILFALGWLCGYVYLVGNRALKAEGVLDLIAHSIADIFWPLWFMITIRGDRFDMM